MKRENGSALVLLLAIVAVVAAVEAVMLIRLSGRVDELEDRTVVLDGGGGGGSEPGGNRMLALESRIRDAETRLEAVTMAAERADLLSEDNAETLVGVAQKIADGRVPRVAPAGGGTALPQEAIDAAVERAVESRLKEMPQQGGEWKPDLNEFQEFLALSEGQADRAEEIFDDAKHAVFVLASMKRDDGTCKIDDLVDALRSEPDPETAVKGFFASLMTDKIPGREEPYIVEIIRIQGEAEKSLSAVLEPEQKKKLGRVKLDYLGVHTSYDPFAEYIQESLR